MAKVFKIVSVSLICLMLKFIFEVECQSTSSLLTTPLPINSSKHTNSTGTPKWTSTGPMASHDCPYGWLRLVSGCYFFSKVKHRWSKANSTCRDMGGNLVVPMNDKENSAVFKIARQNKLNRAWIGLVRHEDNKLYTICGSKPTYTSWSAGQPDNKGGREDCGHFWKGAGQWNDAPCTKRHHFICKYPGCASVRHDCPIGWVRLVSTCYFFSVVKTNWSTANSTCNNLGGNLVVPMNNEENRAIRKLAYQNKLDQPWIGLVRNENKMFYTVYGAKATFTPWASGRPNNRGVSGNCGKFLNGAGQWTDERCSNKHSFICENRNYTTRSKSSRGVTITNKPILQRTTADRLPKNITITNKPILQRTTTDSLLKNRSCPSEAFGVFFWPETKVGGRANIDCPHDPSASATRECQYKNKTFQTISWTPVDVKACPFKSQQMFDLLEKTVNTTNVIAVGRQIRNLSFPGEELTSYDIVTVAYVLENIVAVKGKSDQIADDVLDTVDNILDAPVEVLKASQLRKNSSLRIVQSLNRLLEHLYITETRTFQRTLKNFAVDLSMVNANSFSGVTFSGIVDGKMSSLRSESIVKELSDSRNVSEPKATTIRLPRTLFNDIVAGNTSQSQTVIFALYKKTKFFRVLSSGPMNLSHRLNSYVIAASIKGMLVSDLKNPVVLTYTNLKPGDKSGASCRFLNFTEARWSQRGCTFQRVQKDGRIVCHCDHLTNFAMLMDINPDDITPHEQTLNLISYIGCALSLVGLGLTIITMSLFKDLRSKVPNQILLNFCIASSITLVVFLVAAERSRTSSLASCRTAAIALHYFLLAVFMWMAVEAFNMYLEFVKVLPAHLTKFILKCCYVAWGVPAVIVSITIVVALDDYGGPKYCRLHGIPFIVSFFVPVIFILLGNSVAFVIIFYSLLSSGSKITSDRKITRLQRARQGAALLVLLGLTWLFGVLVINDAKIVFQYLFCICNSLQGLLVFVFYCVLPTRNRKKFKSFLQRKNVSELGKRNAANSRMETGSSKNTKTKESRFEENCHKVNNESTFIVNTLTENPKEGLCFNNILFQSAGVIKLQNKVSSEINGQKISKTKT